MNSESQRIAIAEACGWEKPFHRNSNNIPIGGTFKGTFICDLPDYLNDLNAMHEAEKALPVDQRKKYRDHLGSIVFDGKMSVDSHSWNWMSATAAQRAEAFLKTLNLWK
jgi:hypothetical protein